MDKRLVVGIDPGLHGAVAVLTLDGEIVSIQDAPVVTVKQGKKSRTVYIESQMVTLLRAISQSGKVKMVVIENVHAMPKQGVTSMFSMGMGFGLWRGITAALRLPITFVEPVVWKREMRIAAGSDKAASVVRAHQLFPSANLKRGDNVQLKCDADGRADALLIAEHFRRTLQR